MVALQGVNSTFLRVNNWHPLIRSQVAQRQNTCNSSPRTNKWRNWTKIQKLMGNCEVLFVFFFFVGICCVLFCFLMVCFVLLWFVLRCLFNCLFVWLFVCLVGWLFVWLVGCLFACLSQLLVSQLVSQWVVCLSFQKLLWWAASKNIRLDVKVGWFSRFWEKVRFENWKMKPYFDHLQLGRETTKYIPPENYDDTGTSPCLIGDTSSSGCFFHCHVRFRVCKTKTIQLPKPERPSIQFFQTNLLELGIQFWRSHWAIVKMFV